jgi:hypoxanthine phosphoribosyltransferase
MPRPRTYLSYDAIALWVDSIAPQLRAAGCSFIAGVLRGGMFPAQCVAFATGLPLHFIRHDRATQRASWVGPLPPPGKALVCEEIAGMGTTLANCLRLLSATHPEHELLTVVSDDRSRVQPRWSQRFDGVQVVFPWERHDQVPRHRRDWAEGGATGLRAMLPDHAYRLVAVDLDGVLCDDIAPDRYAADLAACLAERDQLLMAAHCPALEADTHVVVTGRPEEDRPRTLAWLQRHGLGALPVHFRDPLVDPPTDEGSARHKGRTADRLGCTDFIESSAQQAVFLAEQFPQLRVHWWRLGKPVLILARTSAAH